jgi:hypothetical protein
MTEQHDTAKREHRAPNPRTPHTLEGGLGGGQRDSPLQQFQSAVGNARIARLLAGDEPLPTAGAWSLPEVGREGGAVSNQLAGRIYGRLGSGRPLESGTRARMEASLGADLSDVRLHDDAEAHVLSLNVGASAFTLGNDIFFSHLSSPTDEHVLKHELTHVVQQQTMTTGGTLAVGPADDALEHEAEAVAHTATPGEGAPAHGPEGPTVQRGWLEDAYNFASNTAGSVGLGTSLIMESARGTQAAGVSRAGDLLARGAGSGVQSLNNFLGPVGLVSGALGFGQGVDQMLNSATFGDRLTGGTDALFNALGAFSGGVGTASLLGASTASLGPAAAVAGAGAGGYALGRLMDEGVGALGSWITGDEQGDYTISGGMASGMTALDQSLTSLWADPDKPAYTQTLGWKLAEWLD